MEKELEKALFRGITVLGFWLKDPEKHDALYHLFTSLKKDYAFKLFTLGRPRDNDIFTKFGLSSSDIPTTIIIKNSEIEETFKGVPDKNTVIQVLDRLQKSRKRSEYGLAAWLEEEAKTDAPFAAEVNSRYTAWLKTVKGSVALKKRMGKKTQEASDQTQGWFNAIRNPR